LHRADKDDGGDFTGVLILSTTLTSPKSLHLYKRVNNGCDLVMNRKSAGSITLYAKRDTEKSWQLLGTASLTNTNNPKTVFVHIPFDIRARAFEFKIETTASMEFLGMIFREFEMDDSR